MANTASHGGEETTSKAVVFETLYEGRGRILSSAQLTQRLDMSRQAVNKIIAALREEGVPIESIPQKGYRLGDIESAETLSPTLMEYFLRDNPCFSSFIFMKQAESTQSVIKKYARQNEPEGLVAVAEVQTEGRGRRGRTWQSAAGKNLMFSVLLRPKLRPGDVQLLNLAAGMAVKKTLIEEFGLACELKWPNDILCGGKKICGILSEAAGEPDRLYYAVTGAGVNVNAAAEEIDEELRDTATSIYIETGRFTPRWRLLTALLANFAKLLLPLATKDGPSELISLYRTECDTIGREIKVTQDEETFTGKAVDVTTEGAIVVETAEGAKIFVAADVHHLRLA